MWGCKLINTPLKSNDKLHLENSSGRVDPSRYQKIVGGLLYLTHTRPDLIHVVGVVSRLIQAPIAHHLGAIKQILHYILGTLSFGFHYIHNNQFKLVGFTDSDLGGSPDDRKSTSAWVFSLGLAITVWNSKKQHITALSSNVAEYISTTSAACEAV